MFWNQLLSFILQAVDVSDSKATLIDNMSSSGLLIIGSHVEMFYSNSRITSSCSAFPKFCTHSLAKRHEFIPVVDLLSHIPSIIFSYSTESCFFIRKNSTSGPLSSPRRDTFAISLGCPYWISYGLIDRHNDVQYIFYAMILLFSYAAQI